MKKRKPANRLHQAEKRSPRNEGEALNNVRVELRPKEELPEIPDTYLHSKYELPQKGTENEWNSLRLGNIDDSSAAYIYANGIIDKAYNKQYDWFLDGSGLGLSPNEVSELDTAEDRLKGAEGRTKLEEGARKLIAKGLEEYIALKTGGASILAEDIGTILKRIPGEILKDKILNLPGIDDLLDYFPRLTEHSIENAEEYLDYVNQQDRKYLIHDSWTRQKFIDQLEQDIKEIENTDKFGYLPQAESDTFKKQLLDRLNRIIYLNQNYEYEKEMLDNEWQRIKEQWGT